MNNIKFKGFVGKALASLCIIATIFSNSSYVYAMDIDDFVSDGSECAEHIYDSVIVRDFDTCLVEEYDICNICGHINPDTYISYYAHSYVYVATLEPNCLESGCKVYKCLSCGDYQFDDIIPAKDHTPKEVIDVYPSCKSEGLSHEVCSICNAYLGNEKVLDKTDHDYTIVYDNRPTCKEEGLAHNVCLTCDHHTDSFTVEKLEHKYDKFIPDKFYCDGSLSGFMVCSVCGSYGYQTTITNYNTDDYPDFDFTKVEHHLDITHVEATCTDAGHMIVKCKDCDYENIDYDIDEPMISHDMVKVYVNDCPCEYYVACSKCGCPENGEYQVVHLTHNYVVDENDIDCCGNLISGKEKCSVCGNVVEASKKTGYTPNPNNHNYELVVDEEATCQHTGLEHEECTLCHDIKNEKSLPQKEHNYTTVYVAPTCEHIGFKKVVCEDCNYELSFKYIKELDHDMSDELVVVTDADCTHDGKGYYKCKNCDYKEEVIIKAKGHDYVHYSIESTCKDAGKEYDECINCMDVKNVVIYELKDHTLEDVVDVKPSCTNDGKGRHVCSCCDYEDEFVIDKTGHSYGDEIKEVIQNATYDAEGSFEIVTYCKDCNDRHVVSTGKIDKLVRPNTDNPSEGSDNNNSDNSNNNTNVNSETTNNQAVNDAPKTNVETTDNETDVIDADETDTDVTLSADDADNEVVDSIDTLDDEETKEEITVSNDNDVTDDASDVSDETNDESPRKRGLSKTAKTLLIVTGGISLTALLAVAIKKLIATFFVK